MKTSIESYMLIDFALYAHRSLPLLFVPVFRCIIQIDKTIILLKDSVETASMCQCDSM